MLNYTESEALKHYEISIILVFVTR